MPSLPPKFHFTASATLIWQAHDWLEPKILLIHHFKLNSWLCPGGHLEPDELPHQAAERECLEESGLKVQAIEMVHPVIPRVTTEFIPSPIISDLHWVSQENFDRRIAGLSPHPFWPKGCEQHYNQVYMVQPAQKKFQPDKLIKNDQETHDLGWFSINELTGLQIKDEVRKELVYAFEVWRAWQA